jgi:citrate/tricarballylate utilization protein
MSGTDVLPQALLEEGERVMRLCNACRYCEGFCAVFPALERRLSFASADLVYLANLCHNCGECWYACQYAPPHEFELSFSRTMAEIRAASYRQHARPRAFAWLLGRAGRATLALSVLGWLAFLALELGAGGLSGLLSPHPDGQGGFHALLPHGTLVAIFLPASLWAAGALALGLAAFWRQIGERPIDLLASRAAAKGLWDALRLRYLDGAGGGCPYPGEAPSGARRRLHHVTVLGFSLCFASTSVAALYHYALGQAAPYPLLSLPVILGTAGGMALLVGPAGLLWLKSRRNPALVDPAQTGLDLAFLVLLQLAGGTGLLLTFLRETAAMGPLLALHLGLVLALFLTLPYGKLVHAVYRYAALVRHALEQGRPRPRFGAD